MKKVLLVLFIMAFAANMMFAGTPMTNQGDKYLGFTMGGLGDFNLHSAGPVNGVSARYFLSKDMSLRLGLGFSNSKSEPTTGTFSKNESMSFGIAPALVWNMAPVAGSISPYWGVQASYINTKLTDTYRANGTKDELSVNTFGAGVMMGAEWFAWDGISFNAEYSFTYNSASGDFTPAGGTSQDLGTATSMGFNTSAQVGLNVYIGGN
mgnify:CR=1 FL=1